MRSFVAIELSNEIKESWESSLNNLANSLPEINWVSTDSLHITLKFLGLVDENKLNDLTESIKNNISGIKAFNINIEGTGFFPNDKNPKVIWVGVEDDRVSKIAQIVEANAQINGFDKNEHNFHAHITIGRTKKGGNSENIKKQLLAEKENLAGSCMVNFISIMKSTLTSSGPIYERLNKINLN